MPVIPTYGQSCPVCNDVWIEAVTSDDDDKFEPGTSGYCSTCGAVITLETDGVRPTTHEEARAWLAGFEHPHSYCLYERGGFWYIRDTSRTDNGRSG